MKALSIWIGSAVLVLLTLALIAGLGYYKYSQVQAAMNAEPPAEYPTTVKFAPVEEITYRPTTTMIGTVLAPRSIMLSNEVAGTVATINFDPGQIVEERALLVELDASVERAQLDSAKARSRIAQSNFNRVQEAAAARAVTPSELDEAEAQLDQAEAEVAELEAVIERKTLRAPFRAKIGLADTHKGQFLPSGYQIASLQSVSDFLYVDFMIPQSASDTVQVGQPVQLLRRDQRLTAEVVALDSQANRDSRNLLARAKLAGDIESLVPGDSVKVLIEYGEEQTTAAVPVESLQTAPMHTYVFVVESDAGVLRARKRTVVAGPSLGSRLSITTGLAVGEQVVADGGFKLRDGAMITPSQDDESPKES